MDNSASTTLKKTANGTIEHLETFGCLIGDTFLVSQVDVISEFAYNHYRISSTEFIVGHHSSYP